MKTFLWRCVMTGNRCLNDGWLVRCDSGVMCVDPQAVMRCFFSDRAETSGFRSADIRSDSRGSPEFSVATRATHFIA